MSCPGCVLLGRRSELVDQLTDAKADRRTAWRRGVRTDYVKAFDLVVKIEARLAILDVDHDRTRHTCGGNR